VLVTVVQSCALPIYATGSSGLSESGAHPAVETGEAGHAAALTDAGRLAWLLRPAAAPPPRGDGTLALFRAGGRPAELEEVFRRILASGRPLDHVEIACAAAADTTLAWELARRHEWPVTVEPGLPVARTRPGRALLGFAAWVEGGFRALDLRRLLQSGDVRLDLPDGPGPGQAARLLARAGATWGRETYAAALGRLAADYRARAADPETDEAGRAHAEARAALATRLGARLADLLALAPEPDARGAVPVAAALAGARGFVARFAAVGSEHDGAAVLVLEEALAELEVLGDLARPPGDVLALVRDRVDGLAVGRDRARPGCLHVMTLDRAGHAGRPLTFVTGLEEGRVLPPLVEDPVLLDAERAALHPGLATAGDRVAEALHRIAGRLAALGGRVTLSYSCRDLRESRETFPSWLLLQALRLAEPGRVLTYDDLEARLGEPVSAVPAAPERALDDAGWWLARVRGAPPGGRARLRAAFPALGRGEAAERAREGPAFTEFDGWVPEAGAALDFTAAGQVASATALEDLAACPFRHFLRRGLGVQPLEAEAPDPDAWLDPLTRGSVLHALYAQILREARAAGERPDPRRHGPRLHALGEASLAEQRRLRPPPSGLVYEREAAAFHRDLDLFLDLEARDRARTPVGLEVAFGGAPGDAEPLARPEPVTIDLGPGLRFRLRGRIDRIDRLADGRYEAVDYKTGVWWDDGEDGPFAGGRRLQHALYALAAAELLRKVDPGARVASASYYYPTVRGRGERAVRPQAGPDGLRAVLADLVALVRAGAFVHADDDEDCRFCDLGRACGPAAAARAARKLEAGASPALDAFRRLRTHA
jgi:ATP-dependent helicase/nuclease subunit B